MVRRVHSTGQPGAEPPETSRYYRNQDGYRAAMAGYEGDLLHLTVPHESLFVATRHGLTHLLAAGPYDGRPVVLVHGWNANAAGWWPQINALASMHRLLAPDTIGHAGKSAPVRLPVRGPGYGEWLLDVMDGLGLERAHFIGSSGGAWLIIKLGALAPERIASALLLGPAGFVPVSFSLLVRLLAVGMLRPGPSTPRRFLEIMSAPGHIVDERRIARHTPLILHFRSQVLPPTFRDDELRRLIAPSYILIGESDAAFRPAQVVDRAKRILPNLRQAEILPEAGHDVTFDRPDEVNRRALSFLADVSI